MKKNHFISFVILIVGVVLVLFGLYYSNNNEYNNVPIIPTPTPTNDPNEIVEVDSLEPYSGIFSSENGDIYLYQVNDSLLLFAIKKDVYGKAEISNGEAKGLIIENGTETNYIIKKIDSSIQITTDGTTINSGNYQKKENISIVKYYEYLFGNRKYFVSSYNGIYDNNGIKMYMFQIDDKHVEVLIDSDENSMKNVFEIIDNNVLNASNSEEIYTLTINANEIIWETASYESDSVDNIYNGKFTKDKKITMEDVLLNRVMYFY